MLNRDTSHHLNKDTPTEHCHVYRDENKEPWLCILKEDGGKIIYNSLCFLNKQVDNAENMAAKQPDLAAVQLLQGIYRDSKNPDEHPTYKFTVERGHLYMKDGNDKDSFPCLFIPDESGGTSSSSGYWVVSNPTGRSIKIQFPKNLDEGSLKITDIPQLPYHSKREALWGPS